MQINDVVFHAELIDIIKELQTQLQLNNIHLLGKIKDTVNNVQVCCPYHKDGQERKPSAGIHKETGIFHCFACGEAHSLQEVISFCFGYYDDIIGTFGWQWLLKNFATIELEERKDVKLDFSRNNFYNGNARNSNSVGGGRSSNNSSNRPFVSEEELDSYRYIHPYLYERKLTDEIIELFDLGYDAATESITFNCQDIDGNCLFVARRSVKTKWFNYPSNVEKQLYGIYQLHQLNPFPDEVYVCESMIDCCLLWKHKRYAVALNGLGTELQFKQLREMPCRKIILATDMDKSGLKARNRIKLALKNTKLITEVFLPIGRKDIGECTDEEIENLVDVF